MLNFIDGLSRQPVLSNALNVFRPELLQSHDHHIVVHVGELASIVVWKRCCCGLVTIFDTWLRIKRAHREQWLFWLHWRRQKVSVYQRSHCVEALLVREALSLFESIFFWCEIKLLGKTVCGGFESLLFVASFTDLLHDKWGIFKKRWLQISHLRLCHQGYSTFPMAIIAWDKDRFWLFVREPVIPFETSLRIINVLV